MIFRILILLFITVNLHAQSESKFSIDNKVHYFLAGRGDHTGFKLGAGLTFNPFPNFGISGSSSIWKATYRGDRLFLLQERENVPTIDRYPDNYAFPELIPSSQLIAQGVRQLEPMTTFYEASSFELMASYRKTAFKNFEFSASLGASIIWVDHTHINEEWSSATVRPFF